MLYSNSEYSAFLNNEGIKMKFWKISILAMCLVTNIVYLYFMWDISVLTVVLAFVIFYLSFVIQGAFHEVGHFIGGKLSGHKLVVLQIGRGNLICNRKGKLSFCFRKTRGGQCIMLPPDRVPVKYIAYNIGGVMLNALVALGCIALIFINSRIVTLICIEVVFSGIYKVITNLIPSIKNGAPTDGYVLKLLKKNSFVQRDYAKYLSLYSALFWKEKICIEDYKYEREAVNEASEMLYYDGIEDLLSDLTEDEIEQKMQENE